MVPGKWESLKPQPSQLHMPPDKALRNIPGCCFPWLSLSAQCCSLLCGRSQGLSRTKYHERGRTHRLRSQTASDEFWLCLLLAAQNGEMSEPFYASLSFSKMGIILLYLPQRAAEKEEWVKALFINLKQCLTLIVRLRHKSKDRAPVSSLLRNKNQKGSSTSNDY